MGATIGVVSAALAVLARLQLGRSFHVTPKALELVTHGLYARLQHPMYLFVDLTVCGIALALDRWSVLLLLAILLPLQIRNARLERRLLEEKFGAQYVAYRRKTWF
jgi:protein-S-isoprenylcysteine O-methyltransferase Ste14